MHQPTLAEKKAAIAQYIEDSWDSIHHYFELEDGTSYEGSILEINQETILFDWAYSPITDNFASDPFEIPIEQINIHSLLL